MENGKPRALVVEDNVTVRTLLGELLAEWGFQVVGEAATGEEGVTLAGRLRPQVVVMDFRMPGIDGLVATRQIREAVPATQVVMISADEASNLDCRAAAAGAFAFVPKGSARQLRQALGRAVGAEAVALSVPAMGATGGRPGTSVSG